MTKRLILSQLFFFRNIFVTVLDVPFFPAPMSSRKIYHLLCVFTGLRWLLRYCSGRGRDIQTI